jgi:hypothetical protein
MEEAPPLTRRVSSSLHQSRPFTIRSLTTSLGSNKPEHPASDVVPIQDEEAPAPPRAAAADAPSEQALQRVKTQRLALVEISKEDGNYFAAAPLEQLLRERGVDPKQVGQAGVTLLAHSVLCRARRGSAASRLRTVSPCMGATSWRRSRHRRSLSC